MRSYWCALRCRAEGDSGTVGHSLLPALFAPLSKGRSVWTLTDSRMSDSDTLLEIIRHPQLPLASLCLLTSVDPGSEGLLKGRLILGKPRRPQAGTVAGKSREFALGESSQSHRDLLVAVDTAGPARMAARITVLIMLASIINPSTQFALLGTPLPGWLPAASTERAGRAPPIAQSATRRTSSRSVSRFSMYFHGTEDTGCMLIARPSAARVLGPDFREGVAIIVVDNSIREGSTALVVNRPTPLTLHHLDLPRFHAFGTCRLFLGGAVETALGQDTDVSRGVGGLTSGAYTLSPHSGNFEAQNLSPHHWIHRVEGIKGSVDLGGGIFFGGSLNDASTSVAVDLAKPQDFKFFHRELRFGPGQLEQLFYEGIFDLVDNADEALKHTILFEGSVAAQGGLF